MLYRPLWYSVSFLFLGFLYFSFGPVAYDIDNYGQLSTYLFLYMCSAVLGYFFGVKFSLKIGFWKNKRLFKINFWFVAFFSLFSNLVFNYVVAGSGVVPSNMVNFLSIVFTADFSSLSSLYYDAKTKDSNGSSIVVSVIYATLGWGRYIFLPYVIWYWSYFGFLKKLVSVSIIVLPLLTGLSIGLNKPVFDFAIVFFVFSLVSYLVNKKHNLKESKRVLRLIKLSVLLVFSSVFMFGVSMNNRGVNYEYIEYNSPRGDIKINESIPENVYTVSLVMLGHYMYQGYYGLSLSMQESFDSTLGVGHSPFLSRQFERVTGIDVSPFTYQQKIDKDWPDGLRWHSAFAQFANDVHFVGVIFYIFFIFFIMALTWVYAYKYEIREFLFFMPIHAILIIFLPANNQVFGFPDSMSLSFLVFLMLLFRIVYSKGSKF